MSAVAALRRGDLEGALASLKDEIRAEPDVPRHRVFLFQLFSVLGDWDRALTQLNVVRDLDADALLMAQTYQEVLSCEVLRLEVFSGKRSPMVLGEPEPWVAKAIEAQRLVAEGKLEAAQSLRNEAWDDAPATAGSAMLATGDAEPERVEFDWIADSDSRLGPILELIVDGRYYWAPFHRIQQINIEAPADLRDFVWLPAQFTWANGGQAAGLIPTRYPGSECDGDAEIRLARKSQWREPIAGYYEGLGQRVLSTSVDDYALMNLRQVALSTGEA